MHSNSRYDPAKISVHIVITLYKKINNTGIEKIVSLPCIGFFSQNKGGKTESLRLKTQMKKQRKHLTHGEAIAP